MEKTNNRYKRLGIILGIVFAGLLVIGAMFTVVNRDMDLNMMLPIGGDDFEDEGYTESDDGVWHKTMYVDSNGYSWVLGEADPGSDTGGWLATFCLDYAETPATCLASNASGGGYDSWGNVSGV